jgi:hypothetical protein
MRRGQLRVDYMVQLNVSDLISSGSKHRLLPGLTTRGGAVCTGLLLSTDLRIIVLLQEAKGSLPVPVDSEAPLTPVQVNACRSLPACCFYCISNLLACSEDTVSTCLDASVDMLGDWFAQTGRPF